ncbi:MAG: NUDIX hydrolase [Pseudomonadota bacterium]|jgi:ADP-ribose pyrophosphatase
MAETETLFNGRWLVLRRRGTWEYVERVNPRGAVIIVAVTPQDEVLFVEQFRVPLGQRTIEMPAGLVGDLAGGEDEDCLDSAARELEEETGWRAGRLEVVMGGPSSAGMSTEVMTFVRAFDLVQVGAGGGDATEAIEVHRVPRAGCAAFLARAMANGYAIDPKLYAGLYFLDFDAAGRRWEAR